MLNPFFVVPTDHAFLLSGAQNSEIGAIIVYHLLLIYEATVQRLHEYIFFAAHQVINLHNKASRRGGGGGGGG